MKHEQQFKDDLREAYLSVIKKHYGEHGLRAIAMFEIHTFSDEKILKDFGTSGLEALQWYRIMKDKLFKQS
ncbi:hypothetical protein ACKLNO_01260 [Neisseriaceae bacterium B1]